MSGEPYRALPGDARRGGLVLVHDIDGLTADLQAAADGFAEDGYETVAPVLFDSLAGAAEATAWDEAAAALENAIAELGPPVFMVGYGWGGSAAWVAAARASGLAAASIYYGSAIPQLLGHTPRCPVLLHFGRHDASIPPQARESIAAAYPDLPIHLYDGAHGFASGEAGRSRSDAPRLARLRTLQLFALNGGGRGEL